ncbi:MAG: oligosaccharide flippase family protein [Kiritimatiellales bacterium]|nr:oligosaccharide flippase family protein [Kiritimatiellales bacterium]MCF7864788.1 oligosaccharide flippase family protein [Kiritimatiellales bacterium]
MTEHSHNAAESPGKRTFFSHEAVRGVPWMLLSKLVLFFVYFGVSVLTVNGLGKDKFGVFSLMTNISSYLLVVCGLGLGAALMRYVPELALRQNRRGLIHLLWKSALLQLLATSVATMVLLHFSDPLQRLFNAGHVERFRFYLALACGLVGLSLLKEFIATVFTSVFRMRIVAMLSTLQGVVWLVALLVGLRISPEVGTVFYVQMLSIGLVYSFGTIALVRFVHRLPWRTDEFGIGKRRALQFSGSAMLSAILRMMMFKYSEIFFLAAVGGTTLAGMYDLGYSLPYTIVTFIPLALLSLFTAAFAEAYVRDNDCLGRLIGSYYKLLIMVSLPVAVLGAFFAPEAYRIIYSGEMDAAGRIASAFCLVLLLPLLSMPLSMALKAKEKVHNMLPMMMLQIAVNLVLDWLLIVHLRWGATGGICAVLGTFVLTISPRLMVARRIIGGIYFPMRFLLRMTGVLALDAGAFYWIAVQTRLFERFANNWINLGLLFAVAAAYLVVFLLCVRMLHLVRKSDIADFQALEIAPLNTALKLLFGV